MRITHALYGEHGAIYALFHHYEQAAEKWELADLLLAGRSLDAVLLSHAALENELLFAAVEARMPGPGPAAAMRAEHEEIDALLAGMHGADDEPIARRSLLHVMALARDHFAKEEQVLFPLAEDLLGAEDLERLGAEWAARRGVAVRAAAPHGA